MITGTPTKVTFRQLTFTVFLLFLPYFWLFIISTKKLAKEPVLPHFCSGLQCWQGGQVSQSSSCQEALSHWQDNTQRINSTRWPIWPRLEGQAVWRCWERMVKFSHASAHAVMAAHTLSRKTTKFWLLDLVNSCCWWHAWGCFKVATIANVSLLALYKGQRT